MLQVVFGQEDTASKQTKGPISACDERASSASNGLSATFDSLNYRSLLSGLPADEVESVLLTRSKSDGADGDRLCPFAFF